MPMPRASYSRDGKKRVTAQVNFRLSFDDVINDLAFHIADLEGKKLKEFKNLSGSELRAKIAEDLYLHGTLAAERDVDETDDEIMEQAEIMARRAYPSLAPARVKRAEISIAREKSKAVREWAAEHDYEVKPNGRIPSHVHAAYAARPQE